MLKQRIITALVLTAGALAALFLLSHQGFSVCIGLVVAIAAWEWADLSSLSAKPLRIAYAIFMAGLVYLGVEYTGLLKGYGIFYPLSSSINNLRDVLGVACAGWAIALLWVMSYPGSVVIWKSSIARAIMGIFVLVPSALAMIYLTSLENGRWVFIYVMGIVIFADVGAYFIGSKFGKSKLAPNVSPGKSWAGFWGGLGSAMLFAGIVGIFFQPAGLTLIQLIPVTVVCALSSVLGDLLESMVKRHRGIKDSSQLLPGHGGVMDRIDSVSAAAPFFALLVVLLKA